MKNKDKYSDEIKDTLVKVCDHKTTSITDGVTDCCGYDFGIEQFDERIQFCPCCGRKIANDFCKD